jgi:carbonic anhydrase
MRFCSVINCMDGRVQLPVINYLRKRFNVDYVDSITEAGPNLILSEDKNINSIQAILDRLKISVENHNSVGIAIVGHYDCAGNPAPQDNQIMHIQMAIKLLRQRYQDIEIIGLWVDKNWKVYEVNEDQSFG